MSKLTLYKLKNSLESRNKLLPFESIKYPSINFGPFFPVDSYSTTIRILLTGAFSQLGTVIATQQTPRARPWKTKFGDECLCTENSH